MSSQVHPMAVVQGRAGAWRAAGLALLAALAALLVMYRGTFGAMVGTWTNSESFAHGFLIAPIALWLTWRQREVLRRLSPRPSPVWATGLTAAALLWLLGHLAAVHAVTQLAVVAMLMTAIPLLLGKEVARQIAFPIGFLFFMVPLGEFMVPQLMAWTADVTVAAVRLFGVPVYREGMQFVIPTGTWSVIEACSGVRYVVVSLMVGVLFAYLNYRLLTKRLLFVAAAIAVALVANWLRAIFIVMLGHLSENRLGTGDDHVVYGWVVYGLVIFGIFWVGARWADAHDGAAAHAPATRTAVSRAQVASAGWAAATALVLATAAAPLVANAWLVAGQAAAPIELRLPALDGAAPAAPLRSLRPESAAPSATAEAAYLTAGGPVSVHVAYYRQQGYGRKVVSSQNVLVRSSSRDWVLVSSGERSVRLPDGPLQMREAELRSGNIHAAGQPLRVYVRQVYWVDGALIAGDWLAVARGLWGRLAGRGDDAAIITFYATTDGADATALDEFVGRSLPAVVAHLEAVRGLH